MTVDPLISHDTRHHAPGPLHLLSRADLAHADDITLRRAFVYVNERVCAWDTRRHLIIHPHLVAALSAVLHEMIARRILEDFPSARSILVDGSPIDYCTDANGQSANYCTGHAGSLHATRVYDAQGTVIGFVPALSPIQFWLERLTPDSPHVRYRFDVHDRSMRPLPA